MMASRIFSVFHKKTDEQINKIWLLAIIYLVSLNRMLFRLMSAHIVDWLDVGRTKRSECVQWHRCVSMCPRKKNSNENWRRSMSGINFYLYVECLHEFANRNRKSSVVHTLWFVSKNQTHRPSLQPDRSIVIHSRPPIPSPPSSLLHRRHRRCNIYLRVATSPKHVRHRRRRMNYYFHHRRMTTLFHGNCISRLKFILPSWSHAN